MSWGSKEGGMFPWETQARKQGTQTQEELTKERVDDAIVTIRSVLTITEEAQEKLRVVYSELANELKALEDLRGRIK